MVSVFLKCGKNVLVKEKKKQNNQNQTQNPFICWLQLILHGQVDINNPLYRAELSTSAVQRNPISLSCTSLFAL